MTGECSCALLFVRMRAAANQGGGRTCAGTMFFRGQDGVEIIAIRCARPHERQLVHKHQPDYPIRFKSPPDWEASVNVFLGALSRNRIWSTLAMRRKGALWLLSWPRLASSRSRLARCL